MAPDVEDICQQTKNGDGRLVVRPFTNYLPDIVKRYHSMFGFKLARKARKKRRDAGLAKDPETLRAKRKQRGQPKPEAEFLRDRDSAIGRMCKAGIEERQRMLQEPILKVPIPPEDATALEGLKTAAFAKLEKRAVKAESRKRKHHDAIQNPREVVVKKKKVSGQETRWAETPKGQVDRPLPGVALVPDVSSRAAGILGRHGFQVVGLGSDPSTGVSHFCRLRTSFRSCGPESIWSFARVCCRQRRACLVQRLGLLQLSFAKSLL